jgi:hypothetical protein
MSEEERELIQNERSNFAKRKISSLTSSDPPDTETDNPSSGPSSSSRRVQFADTTSAGDQMNRGNRNLIGQIRSSRCYSNASARAISSISHLDTNHSAKAELDSHADTTVAGSTCRILELTVQS